MLPTDLGRLCLAFSFSSVVFTGKAIKGWEGPLFSIDGEQINFEGGGHTFDGQGKA